MKIFLRFFSIFFLFQSYILLSTNQSTHYKILLLGQRNSGKTSFLRSIAGEDFQERSYPSVGIDFRKVTILDKPNGISFFVYDVSAFGKDQNCLLSYFAKDVDGFIMLFDVGDANGLEKIYFWEKLIAGRPSVLLGSKVDQKKTREIERESAEDFADHLGCTYFDVSVKKNHNIKEALESLGTQILRNDIKVLDKSLKNVG
jgi:Ras-related protein Rab-40